jgi:hypothetical protein
VLIGVWLFIVPVLFNQTTDTSLSLKQAQRKRDWALATLERGSSENERDHAVFVLARTRNDKVKPLLGIVASVLKDDPSPKVRKSASSRINLALDYPDRLASVYDVEVGVMALLDASLRDEDADVREGAYSGWSRAMYHSLQEHLRPREYNRIRSHVIEELQYSAEDADNEVAERARSLLEEFVEQVPEKNEPMPPASRRWLRTPSATSPPRSMTTPGS